MSDELAERVKFKQQERLSRTKTHKFKMESEFDDKVAAFKLAMERELSKPRKKGFIDSIAMDLIKMPMKAGPGAAFGGLTDIASALKDVDWAKGQLGKIEKLKLPSRYKKTFLRGKYKDFETSRESVIQRLRSDLSKKKDPMNLLKIGLTGGITDYLISEKLGRGKVGAKGAKKATSKGLFKKDFFKNLFGEESSFKNLLKNVAEGEDESKDFLQAILMRLFR